MQTPDHPGDPEQERAKFEVGSTVTEPRPLEQAFPLRLDEFQILCEGEINQDKSGLNFFAGLAGSAAIGFIGLVATMDWDAVLHQGRWKLLMLAGIMLVLTVGPAFAALCHYRRYRRTQRNSSYSRLKDKISNWFQTKEVSA